MIVQKLNCNHIIGLLCHSESPVTMFTLKRLKKYKPYRLGSCFRDPLGWPICIFTVRLKKISLNPLSVKAVSIFFVTVNCRWALGVALLKNGVRVCAALQETPFHLLSYLQTPISTFFSSQVPTFTLVRLCAPYMGRA